MANVLITGAASGIARAAAKRLAGRLTVYAADRNADGLAETVDEIEAEVGSARAVAVDVADRQSVENMVAAVEGPIDAAFFAAGIHIRGTAETVAEEDWDRMIGVHVKGTFLCCQATLRRMRDEGTGGAIVTMSSDYAVMAVPGGAAYCAAKAAIHSLTKSIAQEFAPDGIRINALGPGPIDTPILRSGRTEEEYEQARLSLAEGLPIGRLGRPEEVAAVVDFLLSERSSYITGQIIHPNGGQLTW